MLKNIAPRIESIIQDEAGLYQECYADLRMYAAFGFTVFGYLYNFQLHPAYLCTLPLNMPEPVKQYISCLLRDLLQMKEFLLFALQGCGR